LAPRIRPVNFISASTRLQYSSLPEALVKLADIATNGECFWPADSAREAARALTDQGFVITGGEVYCRREVGWAAYLGDWTTSVPSTVRTTSVPLTRERSCEEHAARGLSDALRAIDREPAAWGEPTAAPEMLRFFFGCSSERF
jgi:hypothetical protein